MDEQSNYAYGLINNMGMNMSFVTTGSNEQPLVELVADLYSQRKPFLANIYTPDDSFGVIDEATGELQQFEKLAFPRNPDQSMTDPCALARECQNPIDPLMKAANPRLKERYPEAHSFFSGFTLGTRQMNKIVSNFLLLKNNQTSEQSLTEIWLEAACQWLKDDDPATVATWNTNEWLIDVVRYDCTSGCGLPLELDDYSINVGGSCNYYTGLCECSRDDLFADTNCTDSCPGLLGPFVNTSGTEGEDDGYYFEWCSGHGTCDTTTRTCSCDKMWGDTGCGTKYSEYTLPLSLQIVIGLLSCMLAVVCILCIVWLRWNKQYKTVKALSIDMTTIMTVGLLMIVTSNITEKMLMAMLLKFAAIEVLVCVGYSVLHELMGGATVFYNDEELRTEDQCNDNAITGYVSFGSYAYFFVMLC